MFCKENRICLVFPLIVACSRRYAYNPKFRKSFNQNSFFRKRFLIRSKKIFYRCLPLSYLLFVSPLHSILAFTRFLSSHRCMQLPSARISIRRTRIAARICTCNANKPRERFVHMSRARNICVLKRENIVLLGPLPLSLFSSNLHSSLFSSLPFSRLLIVH